MTCFLNDCPFTSFSSLVVLDFFLAYGYVFSSIKPFEPTSSICCLIDSVLCCDQVMAAANDKKDVKSAISESPADSHGKKRAGGAGDTKAAPVLTIANLLKPFHLTTKHRYSLTSSCRR
jgi:hypothetical protein